MDENDTDSIENQIKLL